MIHHVSPSSKYSSNTSNTSQSAGAASHAAQSLVVNATGNGPPPPGPGALGAGVQPSPPVAVGTASGPGAAAAATTAPETNNLFGRIKKACSVKTKFATSSLKHSLQSHQQQTQQQQQNPVTVAVPPPPPKLVNSKGVVNPTSKAMLRPNSAKSKSEPKVPIGTPLTIATAAQLSSSVSSGSSSSSSSSSSASSGVPPVITGAVTKSPAIGANCSPSKQLLNSLFSSATPLGQVQDHGMVQDRGFHQQPQMNNNNGVQRLNNSRQQPPLPPSTLPLAPANEMAPAEPQQQLKSCPLGAISPDSLLLLSTNVTLRRKTPKKMGTTFPPLETTLGSPEVLSSEVSPPKQSPSPAQHRGRVTSSSSSPPSSGHNQLTSAGGTDSLELLSASSAAAAAAETSNRPGDTAAAAAANGTVVTAAPSADHPKQFEARGSSAVEQRQQLATVSAGGEQTATSTFEDVFCKFCCGGAGGVEALERQKSCRHSAPEAVLGMFLFVGSFEEF